MIDARLQPLQRAALRHPAQMLAARGVKADTISIAGFAVGLLAVAALALGWWIAALVLIAANRIMDGLDGAVARIQGPTDRGAFLDIALDFVFYALVPVGFALHDPAANALPAAVLIAAFVGTGSSFLAFAAIAARRGDRAAAFRPRASTIWAA
ncbi:CDP-alcohol phosphatidyltransferase family protein [Paracoccus marcusii]|uniref:CDP-alcohol phosphatidyltransferase family protein n=1 Tax=Paracoccus marcusii TaxID=59779 RepID=UPI002ED6379C|nr:CDP-alcohol phosphatidyltransferase family protein [Paracoccus marcusii]